MLSTSKMDLTLNVGPNDLLQTCETICTPALPPLILQVWSLSSTLIKKRPFDCIIGDDSDDEQPRDSVALQNAPTLAAALETEAEIRIPGVQRVIVGPDLNVDSLDIVKKCLVPHFASLDWGGEQSATFICTGRPLCGMQDQAQAQQKKAELAVVFERQPVLNYLDGSSGGGGWCYTTVRKLVGGSTVVAARQPKRFRTEGQVSEAV